MKRLEFAEVAINAFHSKRVEPKPRLVGGCFGWAIHKYPIKNGISLSEVMADSVTKDSSLWRKFVREHK